MVGIDHGHGMACRDGVGRVSLVGSTNCPCRHAQTRTARTLQVVLERRGDVDVPIPGQVPVWVDGVGQGVIASQSNQRADLASTRGLPHNAPHPSSPVRVAWHASSHHTEQSHGAILPVGRQPPMDRPSDRANQQHASHASHHRSIDRWIEPTHATHTHAPDGLEQVGEARLLGVRHGGCSCLIIVVWCEFVCGLSVWCAPPVASLADAKEAGIIT